LLRHSSSKHRPKKMLVSLPMAPFDMGMIQVRGVHN
jgi:hypothetical protein